MRASIVFAVALLLACPALLRGQAENLPLDEQLLLIKKERDELKVALAQAQMKIKDLQAALAAAKPAGPATTVATTPAADPLVGDLVVEIVGVDAVNTADLHRQIQSTESELNRLQSSIRTAQGRYDDLAGFRRHVYTNGRYVTETANTEAVSAAKAELMRLQSQQRQLQAKVRRLQKEVDDANTTRIVTGRDGQGRALRIIAAGPAMQIATTMQPGQKYKLEGAHRKVDGVDECLLRSASLVAEAPAPAPDSPPAPATAPAVAPGSQSAGAPTQRLFRGMTLAEVKHALGREPNEISTNVAGRTVCTWRFDGQPTATGYRPIFRMVSANFRDGVLESFSDSMPSPP